MNEHDAVEAAFNNGYAKGYADGKDNAMEKIAFPRFLVRQTELSKKAVEDILMQPPTIIMDKTEIIPIYPYRWIPVTERLPEKGKAVLCFCTNNDCWIALWDRCDDQLWSDGEWWRAKDFVTHWMPIPQPPRGE